MPVIIGAWAEVARHRQHPIYSRRYRLGSHRRHLIVRRHRPQTPLSPRYRLPPFHMFCPKICPRLSQLQNQEFDRLVSAVLAEQRRRDRKLSEPAENSRKKRVGSAAATLPSGDPNSFDHDDKRLPC
jgi:hypothetical protein